MSYLSPPKAPAPRPQAPVAAAPRPPAPAPPAGVAPGGSAAGGAPDAGAAPSKSSSRSAEIALAQQALDTYATSEYEGRYRIHKLIGKGAYGAVYVAYDETIPGSPRKVAIKHIINAFVSPTDARRIYREIKVMAHFNHPNILPLFEVIKPRDNANFTHIYLVSELSETDLHRVIHSRQDLTSDHISYFIYQTLCALKCIHAAGVLHRDLKPSNLLVNSDCTVKMCDFGLARESEPAMSAAFTEYVVTRWYRAPEVLLSGGKYTSSVDVWSVGCVLAELLLRRPLFPGENYLHQLQLITEVLGSPSESDLHFVRAEAARNFMLRLPRYEPQALASLFPHVRGPCLDLLARMLTFDPDKRISVDEALAHPFLSRVRAARRGINEESVPPPRPFKLRASSSALKSMAVNDIKDRFYKELCGMVSPTPRVMPTALSFEGAMELDGNAIAAAEPAPTALPGSGAAGAGGSADLPSAVAAAAETAGTSVAAAAANPEKPPAEWGGGSGGMSDDEDEEGEYEDADGGDDEAMGASGRGGAGLESPSKARAAGGAGAVPRPATHPAPGAMAAAAAAAAAVDPAAAVAAAHAAAAARMAGAGMPVVVGGPRPSSVPISQMAAAAAAAVPGGVPRPPMGMGAVPTGIPMGMGGPMPRPGGVVMPGNVPISQMGDAYYGGGAAAAAAAAGGRSIAAMAAAAAAAGVPRPGVMVAAPGYGAMPGAGMVMGGGGAPVIGSAAGGMVGMGGAGPTMMAPRQAAAMRTAAAAGVAVPTGAVPPRGIPRPM